MTKGLKSDIFNNMAKEAREIEAFLKGIKDQESLAEQAGDLASRLEAAGILRIANEVELPTGIRTETLTIGTMSKAAIEEEFRKRGTCVSSYAKDLINRTELSKEPKDLKLAWPSGRDLGLTASSPYIAFLEAGQGKGYNICDPEIALYLRPPMWDPGDRLVFSLRKYILFPALT